MASVSIAIYVRHVVRSTGITITVRVSSIQKSACADATDTYGM